MSVAVSVFASSVTVAACMLLPALIVTSPKSISAACSTIVRVAADLHADRLPPAKRRLVQIGSKPQRVVVGNDRVRKPLGGCGHCVKPLKQREKQEKDVKRRCMPPTYHVGKVLAVGGGRGRC